MRRAYVLAGHELFRVFLPLLRLYLKGSNRVYVVLICDGKIYMVKNWLARDNWRLPGGGIEKGEDSTTAATRELREELGVTITPSALIFVEKGKSFSDKLDYNYQVYAYLCKTEPTLRMNAREIIDGQWLSEEPSVLLPELRGLFNRLHALHLL